MPFAYYGAKHGLASKYPRPRFPTIVEPFAGAAGYSCLHAPTRERIILNDLDPDVVALWERLKTMTAADLDKIEASLADDRTTEPLIASCGGSSNWKPVCDGKSQKITPRMRSRLDGGFPLVRQRIERVMPYLKRFEVLSGSYTDLPDIEVTWFIDPPYQANGTMAGDGYTAGQDAIDFDHLAEWCRTRRGQVIVCEQSPAAWLPFTHLAMQNNAATNGNATRSEVMWCSDQQQGRLFDV